MKRLSLPLFEKLFVDEQVILREAAENDFADGCDLIIGQASSSRWDLTRTCLEHIDSESKLNKSYLGCNSGLRINSMYCRIIGVLPVTRDPNHLWALILQLLSKEISVHSLDRKPNPLQQMFHL